MELRAWKEGDVERIAQIERGCFADPWTEEMLRDCLRYPHYHTFLAEEEGEICGYACLILLFEDGEVANIAVASAFRKRGVGKRLMEAMHGHARASGATRCLLEVRPKNLAAIALYEGFGYQVYGRRAKYYEDGEDALLMEKSL